MISNKSGFRILETPYHFIPLKDSSPILVKTISIFKAMCKLIKLGKLKLEI